MGIIDVLKRANKPKEIYVEPHNFLIPVPVGGTCLIRNQARLPVESFVVQAPNTNTGIVYIGDSMGNAINGLQLVAGQAWLFSVSSPFLPSSLEPTPMNYADAMEAARQRSIYGASQEKRMVINIAHYFAVSDTVAPVQNLIIMYYLVTMP